jgi:hypothetical protein
VDPAGPAGCELAPAGLLRYSQAQQLSRMFCTLESVSGFVGLMKAVEQGGGVFMHRDRPPVSFNLAHLSPRRASLGLGGDGPKAVQRVHVAHAKSYPRIQIES